MCHGLKWDTSEHLICAYEMPRPPQNRRQSRRQHNESMVQAIEAAARRRRAEARARSALRAWFLYTRHALPSAVARILNPFELAITAVKLIERDVAERFGLGGGMSLGEKFAMEMCAQRRGEERPQ